VFSLKETLETFFEYLNEEDFEEGATCMHPDMEVGVEGGELEKLKLFCSLFLEAKNIVEISYSYADARALYKHAALSIREIDREIFGVLAEYADMQAAILRIDRSIYTGYAPQMKKAAQVLKEKTTFRNCVDYLFLVVIEKLFINDLSTIFVLPVLSCL